ncbi:MULTISPECIES: GntR family transcriptional regulator [unclassified Crossiella]|uniref:GntR family transcriptional regulator n=1 Tax=unclassified Crossiella TaxID=2620835 RepID=UPI001FFEFC79|nr:MULTISPECIES: UTRA domain-containing protein [unclassified Crossiella]MCK2245266.1 UTRA domain-containing protein [Crossiella sp. S99.2]MCK2258919.1 UTRA domain-containing protein [Crossiella sp. S99.1]
MTSPVSWTSVSMPYVRGTAGDHWATEAAEHGGVGTQQLLGVEEVAANDAVASALGLAPGEPVIVRRRLMLVDGHPVELVDSYYPADLARDTRLADPRKIPGGAVAFLAGLGYPPRQVREDVRARLATQQERTALQLPDPACVLVLSRTLTSDQDRAVEASVMTMVAEGRRLRYQLTP